MRLACYVVSACFLMKTENKLTQQESCQFAMLLIINIILLASKNAVKSADTSGEGVHVLSIRINTFAAIRFFLTLFIMDT